jgi:phosphoenolpyruvate carboxykinase (ATP)
MQNALHGPLIACLQRPGLPFSEMGINYQNVPGELIEQILSLDEGELSSTGALVIRTGKFTGRSPKDRFIVKDDKTRESVNWNEINQPISTKHFDSLYKRVDRFLESNETWIRDCYACADPRYRLNLRVITASPATSLFCYNMFLRPSAGELSDDFKPDWLLVHVPDFVADHETDGTRQKNFTVINFSKKIVLIGGTAYTGEIKKGIFSVLNYLLPQKGVLSMHCAANVGEKGDTALFFGLSGTGKTTLSNDPNRRLIGDDEHGWSGDNIFNFEGGCYAKCINLCKEKEPQIYSTIKEGALLENVKFFKGTNEVNYEDKSITENTRVSYPLFYLKSIQLPSVGDIPKNIFFLTCDAYGVLPPIARLTPEQAMYQFISGYTAKIAGTEAGITEPKATFSTCFAAPFLPLHPIVYARMLEEKIKKENVSCWLVNTGWTGGPYGKGKRIPLSYTRAMVTTALEGKLNHITYQKDPVFDLAVPLYCPGVPDDILHVRETWEDKNAYDWQACKLAQMFITNFEKCSK